MNYKELQKNYYILSPIKIDNKTVFICRNKNNFLYSFFYIIKNHFVEVDNKLNDKLKNIYKETTKDYVEFYISNKFNSQEKQRIVNIHSFCKKIINENISHLPFELQEKILKKMDTVTYTNNPQSDKYIFAYYLYNDNSINLNFTLNKEKYDVARIMHELLHCCSGSQIKQVTGFLTDKKIFGSGNTMIRLNEYVNEAYTEILRERFLTNYQQHDYDKNFISLYSPIKSMFSNLLKFVDQDKLDNLYFNGNGFEMLDFLAEQFHLNNSEDIVRLSLLFDATQDSLKYEYPSRTNKYPYTKTHLFTIGKLVCELVFNKYQQEGKDISKLEFRDVFKLTHNENIMDKIYNESLAPLTRYFDFIKAQYLKNLNNDNLKINSKDYLNNYLAIFLDCASKNKELPLDFPDEVKSAELFNLALSKRIIQNGKFVALSDYYNIFENVFDENKNFLPLDQTIQTQILDTIIHNQNLPIAEYSRYYPKEILANLVNKNLSAFDMMCEKDVMALFNILDKLHPDRKTTRIFYINFLIAISNKPNKMDLLKFYFASLTPSQQISLTQNGNFIFLSKQNANLNQQEFLDFKKFVETLSKNNQTDIIY